MRKNRAAYYSVVVTSVLVADYMDRIYPTVIRASWRRFPGQRGEDDRAECVAISWRIYLSAVAAGVHSTPNATAYQALRDVAAGRTLCHSAGRTHSKREIPLVYDSELTSALAIA